MEEPDLCRVEKQEKLIGPVYAIMSLKPEQFLVPSCLMRLILFLFACISITAYGQRHTGAQRNLAKADSIVAFFLGPENFQKYSALDSVKVYGNVIHSEHEPPGTADSSAFKPRLLLYQYFFRHPKFSGNTFFITITLDTNGQFVPCPQTRGLVDAKSIDDSSSVNAQQALNLCYKEHHRSIKKKSLRLAWDAVEVSYDTFQKTHNFRDIIPGRIVWQVDGKVEFRGDVYSGTFQVDLLTGTVGRHFAIPWD